MAIETCHVVAGVNRTRKMPLLRVAPMTTEAALVDFLFGQGCKADNLADVAAAFHMFGARPVTGLAAVATLKCRFEVGGCLKTLFIEILVARFADVNTNVLSRGLAWSRSIALLGLSTQRRVNCEHQQRQVDWREKLGTRSIMLHDFQPRMCTVHPSITDKPGAQCN